MYDGMSNMGEMGQCPYMDGFMTALNIWSTASNFREGFRRVVEAEKNDITRDVPSEAERGFTDALRVLQAAKGLSSGSP